jgi:hypothetical protein
LRFDRLRAYRIHRASKSFGLRHPFPAKGIKGGVRLFRVNRFGSTMPDGRHADTRDTLTSAQTNGK